MAFWKRLSNLTFKRCRKTKSIKNIDRGFAASFVLSHTLCWKKTKKGGFGNGLLVLLVTAWPRDLRFKSCTKLFYHTRTFLSAFLQFGLPLARSGWIQWAIKLFAQSTLTLSSPFLSENNSKAVIWAQGSRVRKLVYYTLPAPSSFLNPATFLIICVLSRIGLGEQPERYFPGLITLGSSVANIHALC